MAASGASLPRWGEGEDRGGVGQKSPGGGSGRESTDRTVRKDSWCGGAFGWLIPMFSHAGEDEALPRMGPAPAFTLTTQEGTRLSLTDLHGKIVALTFIYATCADTCPLLTAKMAGLQARLGADFGARVFLSLSPWIRSGIRQQCSSAMPRRMG